MIRFDDALENICSRKGVLKKIDDLSSGNKVVVIRDLLGQFRFYIDKNRALKDEEMLNSLIADLHECCGAFAGSPPVSFRDELLFPDEIFTEGQPILSQLPSETTVHFVERGLMGEEWNLCKVAPHQISPSRYVFWGFQGGVGRSSALLATAWTLAAHQRKNVLIVDLDLESPGISSTILSLDELPDYGIVDWFVEDAIGQQNDALLNNMVASSRLKGELSWLKVVPAYGKHNEN